MTSNMSHNTHNNTYRDNILVILEKMKMKMRDF